MTELDVKLDHIEDENLTISDGSSKGHYKISKGLKKGVSHKDFDSANLTANARSKARSKRNKSNRTRIAAKGNSR
jgi:hypothetical protein